MALGELTLLCFNFLCVGAVSLVLLWIFMQMAVRRDRRPRIYSQPPPSSGKTKAHA